MLEEASGNSLQFLPCLASGANHGWPRQRGTHTTHAKRPAYVLGPRAGPRELGGINTAPRGSIYCTHHLLYTAGRARPTYKDHHMHNAHTHHHRDDPQRFSGASVRLSMRGAKDALACKPKRKIVDAPGGGAQVPVSSTVPVPVELSKSSSSYGAAVALQGAHSDPVRNFTPFAIVCPSRVQPASARGR